VSAAVVSTLGSGIGGRRLLSLAETTHPNLILRRPSHGQQTRSRGLLTSGWAGFRRESCPVTASASGLIIGLPLAFAAGKFLSSQLYGMNPYDPVVTLAAVVVLGLCAFVASLMPALRASRISPLDALRTE